MSADHRGVPPPASPREKPLRVDARRNRDRLLETARSAFAAHGTEASLEDIARQAGVGIGTLYRHFPTREALVEAAYRREVEALCRAADELAARLPPDEALAEWMQRFVGYIATKRGMADSLRVLMATNAAMFTEVSGLVGEALRKLLASAVEAGSIRSDIETADVIQALSGIYSLPNTPDWQDRSRRLLSLLMDGLRWGAPGLRSAGQGDRPSPSD